VAKINLNRTINILSWILVLFAIGFLVSPLLTNVTTYFKQKELQEELEEAKVSKISAIKSTKEEKKAINEALKGPFMSKKEFLKRHPELS